MRLNIAILFVCSANLFGQWSNLLDSSRAIDWTTAGFTVPTYTANCSTQPALTANSAGAAAANTAAIEAALASCDATHNVVNIPAGTYYVAGWTYGSQGKQVVRGAGPNSTNIYVTAKVSCGGLGAGLCMISGSPSYGGSAAVLPPSGSQQCLWTAGYTQGTTTITLSSCGGAPPVNKAIILDQANDTSDTGGIYNCDWVVAGCAKNTGGGREGRVIGDVTYSQQQVVYATAVTSLGGGSYSVTISPGVYLNNIREAQTPGAWWSGFVQNNGVENLTLDYSQSTAGATDMAAVTMYDCYQCWVRNVRSLYATRDHVVVFQSARDVIRDSYFYQSRAHDSVSYCVETYQSSDVLIENNIMQQVTNPIIIQNGTGIVVGYNYSVNNIYDSGGGYWMQASYYNHAAGANMNLWEGNSLNGIWADTVWGSTGNGTLFRNMLTGWQNGKTHGTYVIGLHSYNRAFNVIGNVLGQPSYHTTYEAYATSSSGGVNASTANTSIFELGWGDNGGIGVCTGTPVCDPLARSTLMRWGNYDTISAGVRWDSAEAAPSAVAYVGANKTTGYFDSLAHTLPSSLYHSSKPAWWPSAKAWPPIGPDVTSGNLGICTGTYAGAQATLAGQCSGGTKSSAWAGLANSIPAQDCYLNRMSGPPDGSGGAIAFDANTCFIPPTTLRGTVRGATIK